MGKGGSGCERQLGLGAALRGCGAGRSRKAERVLVFSRSRVSPEVLLFMYNFADCISCWRYG